MTRNNNSNLSKRTYSPVRSTLTNTSSNDNNLINLPDLSDLREDEKQHILSVLLRDETLRNKHLARFMQLRKEVADLEQQPPSTSTSVCARCQTPFGLIFNTGDICPKCHAKVCKQCRLMYNVDENGWLCKLCCKQMQLMSYSGEWMYSLQNNPRKNSVSASEIVRQSLSPSASMRNLNGVSSSDTEVEENTSPSSRKRSSAQRNKSNQQNSNNKINRMAVQTSVDEQKFKSLKQNVKKHPYESSSTQALSQRTRELTSSSNIPTGGSSDDVDSLFDQSINYTDHKTRLPSPNRINNINDKYQERNLSMLKSTDSLSTIENQNSTHEIENNDKNKNNTDCASVTSSEWGADDNKSERNESILQRHNASIKRDTKQSSSSRLHLTGSIQSLRDAVHRIPKPHISTSRTSLNSEQKAKSDISDATLIAADKQHKSNSRTRLTTNQSSIDNINKISNHRFQDSSNTLVSSDEPIQRNKSISNSVQTTNNSYRYDNNKQTKGEIFGSVGNLDPVDSDDDIDGTFEKAKMGLSNRASSCMDIRGSQLSINSVLSDTKARYGLDISGTIELKLTYNTTTGALDVLINKCNNLARARKNQTSDPYVKVYLLPDRSKNSKRKTTIKKNTTEPVYEERLRYHLTKQEFETRVLWISVWSQTSLGQNDFLGEIHIPLANCKLNETEEHQLLAQTKNHDLTPNIEPTMDPGELQFQLTFIENPINKDIGTLQVHYIEGKNIYHGKRNIDAICKGLLMPDKIKRKIPALRKGPAPKWEVPIRWDGVRRDNLKNTSVEISIWSQERFRKLMVGFVRLNLSQGHFDNKPAKWLDATKAEKSAWDTFVRKPTQVHHFRLPLRPPVIETK